jgi:hypothetical protein
MSVIAVERQRADKEGCELRADTKARTGSDQRALQEGAVRKKGACRIGTGAAGVAASQGEMMLGG